MKYMNMKKKYQTLDLQLFAEDGADGESSADGEDSGDGDDQDDEGSEENREEKRFSQKDMDEAVKKRLAREKRKWQREQQKKTSKLEGEGDTRTDTADDKEMQELKEKAARAEEMELKWTCMEHDVEKTCVDDVLALARVHMARNEEMDIEDAIEAVLKKYPQFKESPRQEAEEEAKGKSWGQRQRGTSKKISGVEAAFLKKNPGIKID